jgi:transcription factor IIIB 90 kDa subunit
MGTHFCSACNEHVEAEVDEAEGHSFCSLCGLQLDDLHLESGPTFVRTGDTAHLAGTIIRDADLSSAGGGMGGRYRDDSQARSIDKGKFWIRNFANNLQIPEANTYIEQATRVYSLATTNGFTRGRRTNQVAAACLYVVLRQDRRPYMLIDFCHLLSVNVYVLGSTYIRLTERLRLDTHPVLVCAVDPSLFLHRFAGRLKLPDGKLQDIVQTAMLLIAQMKRDWMQTGRRPAGVCGAALWLACHIHGAPVSRKDVIRVVSIGESTLMHRVSELRSTAAGAMTVAEYREHARVCLAHQRDLEAGRAPLVRAPALHTAHKLRSTAVFDIRVALCKCTRKASVCVTHSRSAVGSNALSACRHLAARARRPACPRRRAPRAGTSSPRPPPSSRSGCAPSATLHMCVRQAALLMARPTRPPSRTTSASTPPLSCFVIDFATHLAQH